MAEFPNRFHDVSGRRSLGYGLRLKAQDSSFKTWDSKFSVDVGDNSNLGLMASGTWGFARTAATSSLKALFMSLVVGMVGLN